MNFPLPFFSKKAKDGDYYFGLLLKEQEGLGIIMMRQGDSIILKSYDKFSYSNGWENLTQDVDDFLFKIEHNEKIHLQNTIFFVFSHLLEEKSHEIKKPYLLKIKDVVKNLDLKALGYIECYEAISNIFEQKDEMPLSAVILELDKSNLSTFIYKSGKVVFSNTFSRTDNLVDDFIEVINPIKKNFVLPSRVLIYDSHDLSDESTKFVSHHWTEDYFVQMPRITIIKKEEIIQGLVDLFNKQINKQSAKEIVSHDGSSKAEIMGFAIGQDILEDEQAGSAELLQKENNPEEQRTTRMLTLPKFSFNFFKVFLERVTSAGQRLKALKISGSWFVIIGVMFILLSLFMGELFLHKAQLTVYYPVQKLDKTVDIETEIDDPNAALPITIATVSAEISSSKATTGNRAIGEKATGEVTLHSFDDKEKLFAKGTVISVDGMSFALDLDVKVASASLATDGSVKLPGKANAKITALEIGTESNLVKGKRFTIAELPQTVYFAINEKSFSGGTKRQVQTVSKKDIDDLTASLTKNAKNTKELIRQPSKKEKIINDLTTIILKDASSSKEVGEESKEVVLKGKATATYFTYDDDRMTNYITNQIKTNLQPGFIIKKENIQYKITEAKLTKNSVEISLSVNAQGVKDISAKLIIDSVKGKPKSSLDSIVKNSLKGQGYKLNISQSLPFYSLYLPIFDKNINLIIASL